MKLKYETLKTILEALQENAKKGINRAKTSAAIDDVLAKMESPEDEANQREQFAEATFKKGFEVGEDCAKLLGSSFERSLINAYETIGKERVDENIKSSISFSIFESFLSGLLSALKEQGIIDIDEAKRAMHLICYGYLKNDEDEPVGHAVLSDDEYMSQLTSLVENSIKDAKAGKKAISKVFEMVLFGFSPEGAVHIGFMTPSSFARGTGISEGIEIAYSDWYENFFKRAVAGISKITLGCFDFFSTGKLEGDEFKKLPDFFLESSSHDFEGDTPAVCAATIVQTESKQSICMTLMLLDKDGNTCDQKNVFPLGWFKSPDNFSKTPDVQELEIRRGLAATCEKFTLGAGCAFSLGEPADLVICPNHLAISVPFKSTEQPGTGSGGTTLH